jgi:hypothetical protein
MQAAAHDPAFAKKAGVPVSVAKEFAAADQAKAAAPKSASAVRADKRYPNTKG